MGKNKSIIDLSLVKMIPAKGMVDILGASCTDTFNKNSTSHDRSDYYVFRTDHLFLFFTYCDMELDCAGIKGGWMRIVNLSNRDTSPSG